MSSRRRPTGFSLIEILFVIVLLGILLALGTGQFNRYRHATALNQAAERLVAELQNTENAARNFGLPQQRNGTTFPAPLVYAANEPNGAGVLRGRIFEKRASNGLQLIRQFDIGDVDGSPTRLDISFSNVPLVNLSNASAMDQGEDLEIAFDAPAETPLATFAFEPDGTLHTMGANVSAFIYLGNDAGQYKIEVTPQGKVSKTKTR